MTHKELKILAVLIVDEQERRFEARALSAERKTCDRNPKEKYASITTSKGGTGGYKSPAQIAHELLTR